MVFKKKVVKVSKVDSIGQNFLDLRMLKQEKSSIFHYLTSNEKNVIICSLSCIDKVLYPGNLSDKPCLVLKVHILLLNLTEHEIYISYKF